ncbi:MAG TPA: hypothetical protein VNS81_05540 [Nocardioides sp.]|nr:hypothetical protein [Nocardioides sp.]
MSDLEQSLGEALGAAAEDAPTATGLAAAARRRHGVRRQRRLVAAGVAAVVVVAAAATTAVTTSGGDGGGRVADHPKTSSPGWKTVQRDGLLVDVPVDWSSLTCQGLARWSPSSSCRSHVGLWVVPSANFDPKNGPGVLSLIDDGRWTGWVTGSQGRDASVVTPDRELTRRILASVHEPGQPAADGSRWTTFERYGLRYQVPDHWGVGATGAHSGYGVCGRLRVAGDTDGTERRDASHVAIAHVEGRTLVTVTAPTQALAELVLAGVKVVGEPGGKDCTTEPFDDLP